MAVAHRRARRPRGAHPRHHRDRARQAREVPRRAHHDGPRRRRQGDAGPDRGRSRPGFGGEQLEAMGDAGAFDVDGARARDDDRLVRGPPAALPRRLDRRARRQRHRQRPRRRRRAAAGADALARARGGPRRGRPARARSTRSPPRRGPRACRSSPATRRSSSAATPTACTSAPPASGGAIRAPRCAPPRCARATGSCSPAPSASTASRSCSRAASSSSAPTSRSDTCSLWPAADALLGRRRAVAALHARRDARRSRVRLQRAGARLGRRDARARGRGARAPRGRRAPARLLGIDPLYVANEGKLVAFVAPERADAALEALRAVHGCEGAAEIGEVKAEPPGMVLVETSFGGRRVMDQLVGDPLPRIC